MYKFNLVILIFLTITLRGANLPIQITFDPISKNGIIEYEVPNNAPDSIIVKAQYSLNKQKKLAAINKYRSATAISVANNEKIFLEEQMSGEVEEFLSAGQKRTLIWSTAQQLVAGQNNSGDFFISIYASDNLQKIIAQGSAKFNVDLSKVVMLDKFASNPNVYPKIISPKPTKVPGWFETSKGLETYESIQTLEPIIFRNNFSGYYAIYVKVPKSGYGEIELELTDDHFSQRFPAFDGHEYFWKIVKMDNKNLIIRQPYRVLFKLNDGLRARLQYVKFVPVTEKDYKEYNKNKLAKRDKIVAGYFEPYSWAFRDYINRSSIFIEAAAAFKYAGVDIVDMQVGRGGAKPLYPSALDTPLMGATKGDPTPGHQIAPTSLGTGRMVRLINPISSMGLGAKVFDLDLIINFGAANNYKNAPLESDFSKNHPEYFIGKYYLNYGKKESRDYMLSLYNEVLKLGANQISIDFCRYPHGVIKAEDANIFMRELRSLADKFSKDGKRIKILVRFPVAGCKGVESLNDKFNINLWIDEKLVDYIVPADFGGMPLFDVTPYVKMAKNSQVKVLPCIDCMNSGPAFPGQVLALVKDYYQKGADGVYLYQADSHIVGSMTARAKMDQHTIRTFGVSKLVNDFVNEEAAKKQSYSSDIYYHYEIPYQSNRIFFWVDGMKVDKMEVYVNDKLVSTMTQEPWMLGEQGFKNHYKFLGPKNTIKVVATVGNKKFTKIFKDKKVLRAYAF